MYSRQSDRGFRVNFLSSITTSEDASFTCMAVHPIHPLAAVCDDSQNVYLHRINAEHLPIHLGQYVHASCIAFHSTLPLVAASSDETNLITFWNIQEVIEVEQSGDTSQLEALDEELGERELEKLNSFATVTAVKPSYITFHPTMPYIVVGCVNFETNSSVIQTFQVTPTSPPVEVSSIVIPMIGEEYPCKKIESIAFSPDGVFLAATFGQKIIVWFFSPTKEMKILIELPIDNTYFKSLVFSPRDFSPRDYTLIVGFKSEKYNRFFSLKIEKDIPQAAPILTTLEGWTITLVSNHTVKTPISTLAFHPILPLLVGGFVNGDVKFYVFDREGDNISELTKFGFTNSIPFDGIRQGKHNVPPPMPSVALNRQFLATCGSNKVDIYAMDGVESAVERFGDTMSVAARASLARKGMPEDIRHLILNKTSYGNSVKGSIAFLKRNVDKKGFLDRPLWLLGIMQQFIDLLKLTPKLPPILFPFQEIITNYYPRPYRVFTNAEYRQTCNEIVERFITENKLDHKSAVVKKIKDFFNSVVDVLVTHRVNLRKDIQTTFIEEIFPILQRLFTLNQSETNHRVIRDIDLKELLEYEKAERAFTQKHREAHQQHGGRKKKTRVRTYKKNKTRARRGVY